MGIDEIIREISKLNGISNLRVLNQEEKRDMLKVEKNEKVIDALKSKYTFVFSKGDLKDLKINKKDKSSVEISKIKLDEIVSALPSPETHKKISESMRLNEKDLTVLVGLDEIENAIKEAKEENKITADAKEAIFQENEKLKAIYSISAPDFKVDYNELFSYLNTRPTKISYSYEFSQEKEEKGDILNYEVLEKINRIRKMEKTIYSAERSDYIPEGITVKQIEQFNLFRKTSSGFALNMVLYDIGFS